MVVFFCPVVLARANDQKYSVFDNQMFFLGTSGIGVTLISVNEIEVVVE